MNASIIQSGSVDCSFMSLSRCTYAWERWSSCLYALVVHFIDFDPPLQKLQCLSLSKTLVSTLGKKWCFYPWDIRGWGIPSCNLMPLFQWNWWFFDRSLSLHYMASWNLLPRAIYRPCLELLSGPKSKVGRWTPHLWVWEGVLRLGKCDRVPHMPSWFI